MKKESKTTKRAPRSASASRKATPDELTQIFRPLILVPAHALDYRVGCSEILAVPREALDSLVAGYPAVYREMMRIIAERWRYALSVSGANHPENTALTLVLLDSLLAEEERTEARELAAQISTDPEKLLQDVPQMVERLRSEALLWFYGPDAS